MLEIRRREFIAGLGGGGGVAARDIRVRRIGMLMPATKLIPSVLVSPWLTCIQNDLEFLRDRLEKGLYDVGPD
jgi:hypothetical protein